MTVLPQAYREQLDDLEIYMGIIKERYRTALINYTVDDNEENKERYHEAKAQLELGYGRLFMLQNNIEKSMEDNDTTIKSIDSEVNGVVKCEKPNIPIKRKTRNRSCRRASGRTNE